MAATPVHNKFTLRALHEEIDLFDRKLAHMLKYDTFATEAARKTSAGKLEAKRELLVKLARQMASEGIEFKPSELPRSLRSSEAEATADAAAQESTPDSAEETGAGDPVKSRAAAAPAPSPFAGTVLDVRDQVEAYKRSRTSRSAD